MDQITGYVDHIIFRNEENGYTVFVLENDDGEVTCVGTIPFLTEGELVEAEGSFVLHPTYGMQWQVSKLTEKAPQDTESIARYLGSGAIKGIGPKLASRIVSCFGEETFRVIEEEPERLAEVKGISARLRQRQDEARTEAGCLADAIRSERRAILDRFGIVVVEVLIDTELTRHVLLVKDGRTPRGFCRHSGRQRFSYPQRYSVCAAAGGGRRTCLYACVNALSAHLCASGSRRI